MRFIINVSLFFFSHIALANTLYTSQNFQNDINVHHKIIFYFVSNGMPLSVTGLKNVLITAKHHGYDVQVLNDPLKPMTNDPVAMPSSYTQVAGVPLHFPIMLVYQNGHVCGAAIPGYKNLQAYEDILSDYDKQCKNASKNKSSLNHLKMSKSFKVNVVMETLLPRPNIAYFFKPINDDWVTYHTFNQVYFFNRKTHAEFRVPGQIDGTATPDATFFTIPAPLRFFSLKNIFADTDNAINLSPDFSDNNMPDEYQSLGILNDSSETRTYRAITAWSATVTYRDYFLNKITGEIHTDNLPKAVCKNLSISLPMISKNGLMLGGHGNGEGYTKIVSIGASGSECTLIENLGFKTSKVAFSHDHSKISFVAKEGDAISAYVYDLNTKSLALLMSVSETNFEYLMFPDFLPNDNIVMMKVKHTASGVTESSLIELQLKM